MNFNSNQLISELKTTVTAHINYVETLKQVPENELKKKPNEKSWSVLDCLEHLNLYASFYNKEVKKRMETSKLPSTSVFKSGFWGNKFAVDMLPKEGMKTMKTFKSKNPIYTNLDKETVLSMFISQQKELLRWLTTAESKNLTQIKTSLTIPILKFKLGDTFRFVINHNERHIVQAKNVLVLV